METSSGHLVNVWIPFMHLIFDGGWAENKNGAQCGQNGVKQKSSELSGPKIPRTHEWKGEGAQKDEKVAKSRWYTHYKAFEFCKEWSNFSNLLIDWSKNWLHSEKKVMMLLNSGFEKKNMVDNNDGVLQ